MMAAHQLFYRGNTVVTRLNNALYLLVGGHQRRGSRSEKKVPVGASHPDPSARASLLAPTKHCVMPSVPSRTLLALLVVGCSSGATAAQQPTAGPASDACWVQMIRASRGLESPRVQDCVRAILADHHGRLGSACARANGDDASLYDVVSEFCAIPARAEVPGRQLQTAKACHSTANCSLGSYCANPDLRRWSRWDPGECRSCDEAGGDGAGGGGTCDEITGLCCSASFEIACGDKYHCNKQCSTDNDCTCGSYCSKTTSKCRSCMHPPSTCDATSGDCCNAAFLDRCPSDPFSCNTEAGRDCASTRWIDGYAVNFSYINTRADGDRFTGLAVFDPANNRSTIRWTDTDGTWHLTAIGEHGISFVATSDGEFGGEYCEVLHNSSDHPWGGVSAAFGTVQPFLVFAALDGLFRSSLVHLFAMKHDVLPCC